MIEAHVPYRIPAHLSDSCLRFMDLLCTPEILPYARQGLVAESGWTIRAEYWSSPDGRTVRRDVWLDREGINVLEMMHFRNEKNWTCLLGKRHRGFPEDKFSPFFQGLMVELLGSLRATIAERKKAIQAEADRVAGFVAQTLAQAPAAPGLKARPRPLALAATPAPGGPAPSLAAPGPVLEAGMAPAMGELAPGGTME